MSGGQYGEDSILLEYFKDVKKGFLVDVGASDGVLNSNSIQLLERGWGGVLIEPNPTSYLLLDRLWSRRFPEVITENCACGTGDDVQTFYAAEQLSTFDKEWRDRCIQRYGTRYTEIQVVVKSLTNILRSIPHVPEINFLSVDCEGRDLDVIKSLDIMAYRPKLVCVELRQAGQYMEPFGYKFVFETRGNRFWERKDA